MDLENIIEYYKSLNERKEYIKQELKSTKEKTRTLKIANYKMRVVSLTMKIIDFFQNKKDSEESKLLKEIKDYLKNESISPNKRIQFLKKQYKIIIKQIKKTEQDYLNNIIISSYTKEEFEKAYKIKIEPLEIKGSNTLTLINYLNKYIPENVLIEELIKNSVIGLINTKFFHDDSQILEKTMDTNYDNRTLNQDIYIIKGQPIKKIN